ncbi:hypothetical protein B0O99DRAFT_28033 [Bisporella sp. PMI_857]|nr:hypothetical protein B0O99DRAFT_28033 [Bisporella sp. PMI_857]
MLRHFVAIHAVATRCSDTCCSDTRCNDTCCSDTRCNDTCCSDTRCSNATHAVAIQYILYNTNYINTIVIACVVLLQCMLLQRVSL